MTTTPDHLSAQFYHGTRYEIVPGQELTASGAKQSEPEYPAHITHVWATTKPLAAAMHARKHFNGPNPPPGQQGHVYQVEPMGSLELDPLDNGNRTSWRSRAGFRVTRELDSPERLLGLERE